MESSVSRFHSADVIRLLLDPLEEFVVSCSYDNVIKRWSTKEGVHEFDFPREVGRPSVELASSNAAISHDGKSLLIINLMDLVICDVEAGAVTASQPFDFGPNILEPIKLGPAAGSLIVPMSGGPGFVLWDYVVGECLDRHESFTGEGIGFIVGESTKFYGYSENAIEVSYERGMHSRYLRHHSDVVVNVRSVGPYFWSTSVDKTLRISDVSSGELVKTHRLNIRNCRPIVANDFYVATVYENFQIAVWDTDTLELSCVLSGHVQEITYLEWLSPRLLVSASEDMCIRVWDTVQETLLCELTIDAPIAAGSYAPTEKIIVVGDKGGRVHFLKLEI